MPLPYKPQQDDSPTGGVIILDKPPKMSSMRAVTIVRHRAGVKAGHAGTLDPLATGVLVVGVGTATRILDQLMRTPKKYRTTIDLSAFTPTDDTEGEREEVNVGTQPATDVIETMLIKRFTGSYLQQPPSYSAKKIDGRRAYQLARKGIVPALEPRTVHVHSIDLLKYEWPHLELDIHSEHGFYVRSLARELGVALKSGGHCTSIRRTAVGPFTLEEAVDPLSLPDPLPLKNLVPPNLALERVASAHLS